jgi:hypothetical protein
MNFNHGEKNIPFDEVKKRLAKLSDDLANDRLEPTLPIEDYEAITGEKLDDTNTTESSAPKVRDDWNSRQEDNEEKNGEKWRKRQGLE